MTSSTVGIIVAISVYLASTIIIGFLFSKKNSTTDDFYLGGRKMGPIVTAMSAEASDMSSWLLMGLPGVALAAGLAEAAWTAIGLAAGTWLNWFFVSRRLRRYSQELNAITVPSFFAKRFHDKKNIITAISAFIIVVFFVPYAGSGFAACGKLFNSLFHVDYKTAMIISAVIIVTYTILGGFKAVCTTDLIQSIVMSIALVTIVGFGVYKAGGFAAVIDNAKELPGYLNLTSTYDTAGGKAVSYNARSILSCLIWGVGYFGIPHVLVRFMAIKDEKKLVISRRIASIWVVIAMGVAVFIGLVGNAMIANQSLEPMADSETVIISIADLISKNGFAAALLAGVILAGILAATMSTADSQLLAASSGVSENILKDFFKVKMSEKKSIFIAKITVVIIGAIGVIIALNPDSSVFKIVSFAWAGFGGAFGAVILLSLFWKRCNLAGALSGMLVGAITTFVWKFAIKPLGGFFDIYELLPAFILSALTIVIVSLCTKAPSQEIVDEFETAKAK